MVCILCTLPLQQSSLQKKVIRLQFNDVFRMHHAKVIECTSVHLRRHLILNNSTGIRAYECQSQRQNNRHVHDFLLWCTKFQIGIKIEC